MKRKAEYYEAIRNSRRGNITVYDIEITLPRKGSLWRCKCDCGNEFLAETSKLSHGQITSCPDCGRKRSNEQSKKQLTKHNLAKHPLHTIWWAVISRCKYKGDTNYAFYGGRGIGVCAEWENDFKAFFDWATSNGYEKGLTLDRIDVNGNYEPANCRWITQKEQCSNKRNNVWITVDGETKTQQQWAESLGISHAAISHVRKNGECVEDYIKRHLGTYNATVEEYTA